MLRKKKGSLEWWEFELFQGEKVRAHVLTRKGGVSTGSYQSLNLGWGTDDDPQAIYENQRRLYDTFAIEKKQFLHQEHKDRIHMVSRGDEMLKGDGLMTKTGGLFLGIGHADCQAAVFYDPCTCSLAVVHAGWRGMVLGIYSKMIRALKGQWSVKPENLLVGISPSLGPSHAEFIHYEKEFPEPFWDFQIKPYYFDLWQIASEELLQGGILPHHLEMAKMCTFAREDDFFSYRREKKSGRNALIASVF